ncbi:hypothetical protein V9T40_000440 [Parthenolecanium corni]|uniref:SAP domain-containing protein n=1 Tax=Parthenolecanium corni TaxID=536013 RepID=A0AAN9TQF5_9HEMI
MSSDYSSFKVVDLKKELKTRGLSTAGNKDELVERLNTYTQNLLGTGSDIDGFGESIAENDILEEDVLGEELDYEEDELKKSSELEFPSPNESSSLDIPADVSVDSNNSALNVTVIAADDPLPQRTSPRNSQKPGEKKVHLIRNRSLSIFSDSDLKENNKVEEETNEKKIEESDHEPKKITIKSSQSEEERLEERKRKFGVLDDDEKKRARAARFGITDSSTKKSGAVSKTLADSLEKLKSRAERFGSVISPLLSKLSEEEKMQARKNRFSGTTSSSNVPEEEKKKLRAQRFNISKFQKNYIHSSAICHHENLMDFFDDESNWGKDEVKTGRSWMLGELRNKSSTDLHKLWYVLYKEKNMLLTMEEFCQENYILFPSPERIDKVEESMKNLETVVRERNKAYYLLETGEDGERPGVIVHSAIGLPLYHRKTEHVVQKAANKWWKSNFVHHYNYDECRKFLQLYREKLFKENRRHRRLNSRYGRGVLKRFKKIDMASFKEQYPGVKLGKNDQRPDDTINFHS